MDARYGDESSGLKVSRVLGEFAFKHLRNLGKRIGYNYFLRDLPVYWERVEAAYSNKDLPVLGTSVHTCKTLFGYVGFTDLQEQCQQFENKCSVNSVEELRLDYILLIQRKEKAQHIIAKEYDRLRQFNGPNG